MLITLTLNPTTLARLPLLPSRPDPFFLSSSRPFPRLAWPSLPLALRQLCQLIPLPFPPEQLGQVLEPLTRWLLKAGQRAAGHDPKISS